MIPRTRTSFTAEQFAHPYPDGIQDHYWMRARNELVLRMLRQEMSEPAGVVIDVGCGRGITIEYLRRHAVDAVGADTGTPAPILPAIAPYLHLGQDALALPLTLRKQVRAMLLLDVLEHLPAPAAFMASLMTAFEACRNIIITVPARQELWSNYDEYYGHYRRYDLGTVGQLYPIDLLETTGIRYAFRLLYPPALALSVLKIGRSISIAAPSPRTRPLHRILARYFQLESALLPRWLVGTSLMMTLRRRDTPSSP